MVIKRKIALSAVFIFSFVFMAAGAPVQERALWVEPIKLDGAPNLFKVSPELYRSVQPAAEIFKNLEKLGIKNWSCLKRKPGKQITSKPMKFSLNWQAA